MKNLALAILTGAALTTGGCATAEPVIPDGFESRMVQTIDLNMHAVLENDGQTPVILLHGWPQDWSEWRHIMPGLAERYRVIAVDLRGVGLTQTASDGFDKVSMADDIVEFLDALDIEKAHIVGHDIGGMVAFALATDHSDRALSISFLDLPFPGSEHFTIIASDPRAWHFGFHATPHLPEQVVSGNEGTYFSHFYTVLAANPGAITAEDVDRFVTAYEGPDRLTAGFEFYRSFAADAEHYANASLDQSPRILIAGGEASMGALLPMIEGDLRAKGASDVSSVVIPDAGHWIAEENPDAVSGALIDFFGE